MITEKKPFPAKGALLRSLWLGLLGWSSSLFIGLGDLLAGGGKPATKLVNVADTRIMEPGLSKWMADIYNTDMWLFAALVVTIMAGMGLVLGTVFDRLMGLLGIHMGKIEHHE